MPVMHRRIARHHSESTPTSLRLPGVIPKEGVPDTLTNGDIGYPEEKFRRTNPTEAVGDMVVIKIK